MIKKRKKRKKEKNPNLAACPRETGGARAREFGGRDTNTLSSVFAIRSGADIGAAFSITVAGRAGALQRVGSRIERAHTAVQARVSLAYRSGASSAGKRRGASATKFRSGDTRAGAAVLAGVGIAHINRAT